MHVLQPQSFPVQVPRPGEVLGIQDPNRARQIAHITKFFRESERLPEALNIAQARARAPRVLKVASIGCSLVEVDSLLALYNNANNGGRMSITGFDASPTIIQEAKKGIFWLDYTGSLGSHQPIIPCIAEKMLGDMGFRVSYLPSEGGEFQMENVRVDTSPVRLNHEVEFVVHDASKPLPDIQGQDLVLANNSLEYYMSRSRVNQVIDERAFLIARNAADILSEHGVLSFGGVAEIDAGGHIDKMLNEEFGLTVVSDVRNGHPLMYGRV